ncbi:MAG: CHASE2 domain-containing protein [Symploca sp. SIO2C1]|nr:CHASE2 domain-containing protein [Symploca sp. SIO2C1]
MVFLRNWQFLAGCLGILWSLLYYLLSLEIPLIENLDLEIQNSLMKKLSPSDVPSDIILVTIERKREAKEIEIIQPDLYLNLLDGLIDKGKASVVILHFPNNWELAASSIHQENAKEPKRIDRNLAKKIVLAAPVQQFANKENPELPIYNEFLSFQDKELEPEVSPEQVNGFFEYSNSTNLNANPDLANLLGKFRREDNQELTEFKSSVVLALEKHLQQQRERVNEKKGGEMSKQTRGRETQQTRRIEIPNKISLTQWGLPYQGVWTNFWGATDTTFESIPIESICSPQLNNTCQFNMQEPERLENKIVLIGFTDDKDPNSFSRDTPWGKMPEVERQANLLASLMTGKFYRVVHPFFEVGIIVSGGVLISLLIASPMTKLYSWYSLWWILLSLAILGGYSGLSFVCLLSRWVLPITRPLLTWTMTGGSVAVCLLVKRQQDEIKRLKFLEQEAILDQTRKLLHRTATDIHQRELGELRNAMDCIEILSQKYPALDNDPIWHRILPKLQDVGIGIRKQLNDLRSLANKLKITPELRAGLHWGMGMHIKQLRDSGKLKLPVIEHIKPLQEPKLVSAWIDAREDIFCFFREAIANIIYHAQPPKGSATEVKVSLFQQGNQCTLTIENDGVLDQDYSYQPSSGNGTKIMETIAAELPEGFWERLTLPNGRMLVKLVWNISKI